MVGAFSKRTEAQEFQEEKARRWLCPKNTNRILRLVLCLGTALLLVSCVEITETIDVNRDGSGEATLAFKVVSMFGQDFFQDIRRRLPREWAPEPRAGNQPNDTIIFRRQFRDVAELSDNDMKYQFATSEENAIRSAHSLNITLLKYTEPLPIHIILTMPGTIESSNGNRISSNQVRWDFQGLRQGETLSATSKSWGVPSMLGIGPSEIAVMAVALFAGAALVSIAVVTRKTRARRADTGPKKTVPRGATTARRFCPHCGEQQASDSSFCTDCGKKLV